MDLEKQENANKLRRVRVTNAFTNIKAKYPLDDARQRVIHMFYFKDGTAVRFKSGPLSTIAQNLKRSNIEFMDKNGVYKPLKGVAPKYFNGKLKWFDPVSKKKGVMVVTAKKKRNGRRKKGATQNGEILQLLNNTP